MGFEIVFAWWLVGWFTASLVALACFVWLLRSAPASALRTAFAMFLLIEAGAVLFPIHWLDGSRRYFVGEVADICMVAPLLLLLATWFAAERGTRLPRWLPLATAALIGALAVAWIVMPSWRGTLEQDGVGLARSGILFAVTETIEIAALVTIGVVFMRAAVQRDSVALALAGFGFAGWSALLGLWAIIFVARRGWTTVGEPGSRHLFLFNTLVLAAAFVYIFLAVGYIIARSPPSRARRVLAGLMLGSAAVGLVLVTAHFTSREPLDGPWSVGLTILSGLSLMLAYVFGSLFVIAEGSVTRESRVWKAARHGALPALMVATFFVVSEATQSVLSGSLGPIIGVVATAPLILLFAPIQRLGERLGHAVAPAAIEKGMVDREDTFERQVRYAWVDGKIGPNERSRLGDLRRALGISAERAEAIEESVITRTKVPT